MKAGGLKAAADALVDALFLVHRSIPEGMPWPIDKSVEDTLHDVMGWRDTLWDGVERGVPCHVCGGFGFHNDDCSEVG